MSMFLVFQKQLCTAIFLHKSYCNFQLTVKCYCCSSTELHFRMIALTSVFFFCLPHLGREKVLEDDDEFENNEIEDAFESNNFLVETLKKSLQRLGKDLVNGECFLNASVKMLGPLYYLIRNHAQSLQRLGKDLRYLERCSFWCLSMSTENHG